MMIQGFKKYAKILKLISLAIVAISFCVTNVYADDWNGSGVTYQSSGGSCNQSDSQLCLWDNKNHVLLKVSLYYFTGKTGLNGGIELGYEIYGRGGNYASYAGYFAGKTLRTLSSDFGANNMNEGISSKARQYFYNTTANFYTLFKYITGVSGVNTQTELQNWMLNYCQTRGYGNTLSDCHQTIGGNKGFRIVIQPIITGIYGSTDKVKVATVKTMFKNYDIWNSDSTVKAASAYMYLNEKDLGFSIASSAGSTDRSTVSSDTSGYGLNMFTWPGVDSPCNPSVQGVKTCCSLYGIKNATDAANHDTSKVTSPMSQAALNSAGCNGTIGDDDDDDDDDTCTNTYKITKTVPSTCENGVSGVVSDSASWKCVFTSTLASRDTTVRNNYVFSSFSNKYCSVYCKEKIEYQLPGTGAYADAGRYFVISSYSGLQNIGPIRYTGTSTCRVTNARNSENGTINVSQFVSDFNNANYAVLVAYDRWQYAELQNEVINAGTSRSWSSTCSDTWCVDWDTREKCTGTGKKKTCTTETYCADYDSCSEYRSGTYWTYNNKYYSGSTFSSSTGISNGSCGCNSRCGSSCTPKASLKDTASLKSAYQAAVNYRTSLLEELKKCNNFYKTYNEFKPNLTFAYEDVLYKNTYTLKATGTATSSTDYFKTGTSGGSKNSSVLSYSNSVSSDANNEGSNYRTNSTSVRGYSSLINYYDCGYSVTKRGCTAVSQYSYPTNAWFEQVTKRTYNYTLPDGINNYVDKPSGFSSSTPTASYDYIPFSNLPIHFSTKPGDYKYTITTTTYGPGNKFNSYIIGNTNFNRVSYHEDNKYNCTYKIDSKKTIICVANSTDPSCDTGDDDGSGTDLIYRQISLYYPFPGQNATTSNLRTPGKNWASASGSDAISKFIYNNRGVSYYELYNLQPMYEVTLTPALMRKIKEYNQAQNNTKQWYYRGTAKQIYTSVGYSDFSLDCKSSADGSKSSKCTSPIIRSWGVRGCAISGSGYSRCGNTVAW